MIRRTFCLSCGAENRGVQAQCLLCRTPLVWPTAAQPAAAPPVPEHEPTFPAQAAPKRERPAPPASAPRVAPKPVPQAAPKRRKRGLRVVFAILFLLLLSAGVATGYLAANGNRQARALIEREQYASAIKWGDWMTRLRLPANAAR